MPSPSRDDHTHPTFNDPTPRPPGDADAGPDRPDDEPDAAGPDAAGLRVVVGGRAYDLDPDELENHDVRELLLRRAAEAAGPVTFVVADLPGWEDEPRWHLLSLAAELGGRAQLVARGVPDADGDPFRSVLAAVPGPGDEARYRRGRRAAVEAAALFRPGELDAACGQIAARLRDLGVASVRVDELMEDALALARPPAATGEGGRPTRVRDVLADAPVPDDVVVPPGWVLSPEGVRRADADPKAGVTIPAPVVIAARLTDAAEQTEWVRLAWWRDGGWVELIVRRSEIADAGKVVALADRGLPVNSVNARDLVRYLADSEAANLAALPRTRVSSRMGWQGEDGADGFLWGRRLITAVGTAEEGVITFRGADEGDEQLADAFHARGTYDDWLAAVAPLAAYPRALLGLYAALVPPMLTVLRSGNFMLEFAGETSNGKTTTQRVAASPWGAPDERAGASALLTWDSTRVYIGRAAVTLNNLPLILDDTKRARRPEDVAQTVYDVTSGRDRGRGSVKGTQRSRTSTTVLISSGESPATGFTQDGGTRARVLVVWGSPFGGRDAATAAVVRAVDRGVRENYGHAGPRFVRFLLERRADWPEWRAEYERVRDLYAHRARDNPVGSRMAAHLAALSVTARLAHLALGLPWDFDDPVAPVWDDLLREGAEADRATRALEVVVGWASSHQDEFFGRRPTRGNGQPDQPPTGWAGRWDTMYSPGDGPYVGFFPQKLRAVLEAEGFEYDAVVRTWKDRGWLILDSEGRPRYRARVGDENPWLVAIRQEPVVRLAEPAEEELTPEELNRMLEDFWGPRRTLALPPPRPSPSPDEADGPRMFPEPGSWEQGGNNLGTTEDQEN